MNLSSRVRNVMAMYYRPAPSPHTLAGDTVGLGYSFADGVIFFAHNGVRLPVTT